MLTVSGPQRTRRPEPNDPVTNDFTILAKPERLSLFSTNHEREIERPRAAARGMVPSVKLGVIRLGGKHLDP